MSKTRSGPSPLLPLVALILLAAAPPVEAQTRAEPGAGGAPAGSPVHVTLIPTLGTLNPSGEVSEAPILDEVGRIVRYGDFTLAPSLGLAVEVSSPFFPLTLRAGVHRSVGDKETGTWGCALWTAGFCPNVVVRVPTRVAMTIGSLDASGWVPAGDIALRPIVGLSWVHFAYSWDASAGGSVSLAPGSAITDAAAMHLGAQLSWSFHGLEMRGGYETWLLVSEATGRVPERVGAFQLGVEVPLLR